MSVPVLRVLSLLPLLPLDINKGWIDLKVHQSKDFPFVLKRISVFVVNLACLLGLWVKQVRGSDNICDSKYLHYQTPPTFVEHSTTSGMAWDTSWREVWEWSLGMRLMLTAMLKGGLWNDAEVFIATIGIDFMPCNILPPTTTIVIPDTVVSMNKEIRSRLEFLSERYVRFCGFSCSSELWMEPSPAKIFHSVQLIHAFLTRRLVPLCPVFYLPSISSP